MFRILPLIVLALAASPDGAPPGLQNGNDHPTSNRPPSGRLTLAKIRGRATGGAVLDLGSPGRFDAQWATCPSVLYDGKAYRMWYSSLYDSKMGAGGIGLATSTDGLRWKRANDGQPVLTKGPDGRLDDGQVMGPEVFFDGRRYLMWYTGMGKKWHQSGFGYYRIFLATSGDGIHWKPQNRGRPVLDVGPPGSFDEVQAATPSVIQDGKEYRMWYAAWSPRANHTICAARSRDGVHWTREQNGRPVTGLRPSIAYGPAVCKLADRYLMLYMALNAERTLYAAISRDGLHWKMMNDGQGLLPLGENRDFDGDLIGHPFAMLRGNKLRVWYTGYRREKGGVRGWKLRIGLCEGVIRETNLKTR